MGVIVRFKMGVIRFKVDVIIRFKVGVVIRFKVGVIIRIKVGAPHIWHPTFVYCAMDFGT